MDTGLVSGGEAEEVFVLLLRMRAAVIAGDVGDQLEIMGPDAGEPAVADEVVAVLVVVVVVDDIADILEPGGTFQERPVGRIEAERLGELFPDPTGQRGHGPAMLDLTGAGRRQPFDGRVAERGMVDRRLVGPEHVLEHLANKPVADAACVDDEGVDPEALQKPVDDRQAGDDDVGPVRGHAGQGPPRPYR